MAFFSASLRTSVFCVQSDPRRALGRDRRGFGLTSREQQTSREQPPLAHARLGRHQPMVIRRCCCIGIFSALGPSALAAMPWVPRGSGVARDQTRRIACRPCLRAQLGAARAGARPRQEPRPISCPARRQAPCTAGRHWPSARHHGGAGRAARAKWSQALAALRAAHP
jgi:hypothetical protein